MISVIIPLYFNDLALYPIIIRCLESIPDREDIEIVIMDDYSPLDTTEFLEFFENRRNRYQTVENADNTGYTENVNAGIQLAEGDVFVIMNDDIMLQPGQLERFIALPDGVYSPKTTDEGPGDKFGSLWGMNRATYEKMGPLNEDLKDYFSDTEYYDRAKKLGIPVVKWDDMTVDHLGGATYRTLTDRKDKYERDFAHYRDIR